MDIIHHFFHSLNLNLHFFLEDFCLCFFTFPFHSILHIVNAMSSLLNCSVMKLVCFWVWICFNLDTIIINIFTILGFSGYTYTFESCFIGISNNIYLFDRTTTISTSEKCCIVVHTFFFLLLQRRIEYIKLYSMNIIQDFDID